ncbi:type IV pilin [Halapricum desulfuricans]|uniref:Pilin/Flagellin, FlaG/FlaF family n=1 Tax=Halapricum desulfuricans TaxID=2841257 RepID=A0A897NTW8_9EURY|nr:type IV pilin N-terminal domain-containing protein [Halapricum desulfuricans]QSG15874.1 Pilin/Flagellin, FlaG/FlaF family [Halapricum desulfuricans]
MNPKELLTDDDAVSPVIGVILMVAITVILAAVIASFVLGLGDSTSTTPTADFNFDYDNSTKNVTVSHSTGDNIDADRVEVLIDGDPADVQFSGEISSGSSISFNQTETGDKIGGGETIKVTWESEDQESSSTLSEYDVPDN